MITDRFISAISRAFWRRIEPYKNKFEEELPEKLPVEFESFMGTALSQLEDKVLVWIDTPSEPDDNSYCLIEMDNGNHALGYYNDVQKVFSVQPLDYVFLSSVKRWTAFNAK